MKAKFEFSQLSLSDPFKILFPLRYEIAEISTIFLKFSWLCPRTMLQLAHWESTEVAFRQSVAAEFRLTDTMFHSQLALCCLSLTLRKVRGNKYWQSGVSEITKYERKQESKAQLLHVWNKSRALWQACSDCLYVHHICYSPDETGKQKGKGKLNKDGTVREIVVRYKFSE